MKSKSYINAVIVSLLIHIVMLAIWSGVIDLNILKGSEKHIKPEESPLVFELQEQQRRREVVETPEDARVDELQKKAELASDKNAIARNSETNSQLPLGDPFSRGDVEFRELPNNPTPPGEQRVKAHDENSNQKESEDSDSKPEESGDIYASLQYEKFNRDYLTKQKTVTNPGAQENVPRARYDNPDTRALEKGAISFNTYEWDFAPYMIALKKRVERNIFPPPAFTYMGIISGETLLKFRIYPNGELRDLTLLSFDGHETLMQTSMRAIEISAPFLPLPANFPEAYLEVTAKFNYYIPKSN